MLSWSIKNHKFEMDGYVLDIEKIIAIRLYEKDIGVHEPQNAILLDVYYDNHTFSLQTLATPADKPQLFTIIKKLTSLMNKPEIKDHAE